MKLFFYDFETTGLDTLKSAPHQLSGRITVDGKIMEDFNFHIRPFDGADIDPKALDTSHVTLEQIMAYPTGEEVYKQLCQMLLKYVNPFTKNNNEKFVTVGYNNSNFDDDMLYNFFGRYYNIPPTPDYKQGFRKGNFFNKYLTFDIRHLAMLVMGPVVKDIENYKLGTVANYTGTMSLNEGELHSADFDIDTTYNLFKKFYKENIKLFHKE